MWNLIVFVFAGIGVSVAQPPLECMPPPLVDPAICCPTVPKFMNKQIIQDCVSTPDKQCEASTCMLRKGNFLTADGKVDKAALQNYPVSSDWTGIINTGLQKCFSEMNGASCESLKFLGCMVPHLLKNCPASVWNNSAECAAVKEFTNKCLPPGTR